MNLRPSADVTIAERASCAVTTMKSASTGGWIRFQSLALVVRKIAPPRPTTQQTVAEGAKPAVSCTSTSSSPPFQDTLPSMERSIKPPPTIRQSTFGSGVLMMRMLVRVSTASSASAADFPRTAGCMRWAETCAAVDAPLGLVSTAGCGPMEFASDVGITCRLFRGSARLPSSGAGLTAELCEGGAVLRASSALEGAFKPRSALSSFFASKSVWFSFSALDGFGASACFSFEVGGAVLSDSDFSGDPATGLKGGAGFGGGGAAGAGALSFRAYSRIAVEAVGPGLLWLARGAGDAFGAAVCLDMATSTGCSAAGFVAGRRAIQTPAMTNAAATGASQGQFQSQAQR